MSDPRSDGLRYIALDEWSGYGQTARRFVTALRALGVPVEYRTWAADQPRPPDRAGAVVADGAPVIAHLVPETYPQVRATMGDSPLIAHTVWETDRLPAHWPALLNAMDLVIVPCAWNREVFAASGVTVPIAVVPHIACVPETRARLASLDLPDDVVVFYTIARWDERKAPSRTLRAFLEAFDADDPVALVFKTDVNAGTFATSTQRGAPVLFRTPALEVARVMREYRRPARVRLEVGEWTDAQIAELHARADCFVSLTHGEGWGNGEFDAAAYGNTVVTTGWGGTLEYLDPESAWLVDYDLVPVRHPVPSSYSPDQHWAEARLDHAVASLREIAGDLDAARRRASPLAPRILTEYDGRTVARRLLDSIPPTNLC